MYSLSFLWSLSNSDPALDAARMRSAGSDVLVDEIAVRSQGAGRNEALP